MLYYAGGTTGVSVVLALILELWYRKRTAAPDGPGEGAEGIPAIPAPCPVADEGDVDGLEAQAHKILDPARWRQVRFPEVFKSFLIVGLGCLTAYSWHFLFEKSILDSDSSLAKHYWLYAFATTILAILWSQGLAHCVCHCRCFGKRPSLSLARELETKENSEEQTTEAHAGTASCEQDAVSVWHATNTDAIQSLRAENARLLAENARLRQLWSNSTAS